MYEDNKVSVVRRIIWLAISVLVIAGLVWLMLWLFMWRGSDTKTSNKGATQKVTTSQKSGSSATKDTADNVPAAPTSDTSSGTSTDTTNTTTGSTGATSSTSTTQPVLANTGPGSFVAPIALTIAAGTVYYQVRLRRKLQR